MPEPAPDLRRQAFPFLCLVESNLTQLSECRLKGKIICHPTALCESFCLGDSEHKSGSLCYMCYSRHNGQ